MTGRFGDNVLENYCEIVISNVTNTSFDFTVYEVNVQAGKKENKKGYFSKKYSSFYRRWNESCFLWKGLYS